MSFYSLHCEVLFLDNKYLYLFLYYLFFWQKFEDDMSYWTSLGRGGNEYYGGYYQHHYDEDSPIGPRNPHTFRHGAGVNYDDY